MAHPFQHLLTMLFPLFIVSLLLYGLAPLWKGHQWVKPYQVALVDQDETVETKLLTRQFQSSKEMNKVVSFQRTTLEKAKDLLQKNKIAAIVVLPKGFTNSLQYGENKPAIVTGNAKKPLEAMLFKEMMEANAKLVSAAQSGVNTTYHYMKKAGVQGDKLDRILKQLIVSFSLQSLGRNNVFETVTLNAFNGLAIKEYFSISLLLILFMLNSLFALHMMKNEEQGVLKQRLTVMGVNETSVILADFIVLSVLTSIQTGLLLGAFSWLIDSINLSFVLIAFLFTFTMNAFFIWLTSIGIKGRSFISIGLMIILLFSSMSGIILPLSYLPATFEAVSHFLPVRWAQTGLISAIVQHSPTSSVNLLVALCFGFFILALIHSLLKRRGPYV